MRVKSFCTAILLFAGVAVVPAAYAASDSAQATVLVARAQVLSQQLASASRDAAGGNADAFASLKFERDTLAEHVTRLDGFADRVAPKRNFADLDAAWAPLRADAGTVLDNQQVIVAVTAAAADISARLPGLNSRVDEVVRILAEHPDSAVQVMVASRQMLLADRMQRRIQSILNGGDDAESAAMGLQRDAAFYGAVLTGLIKGNKDLELKAIGNANARTILKDVDTQWTELAPIFAKVLDATASMQAARQAALKTADDAQTFLGRAEALMSRINE